MNAGHGQSTGLKPNLVLLALLLITAVLLFASLRLARALGLGPEEQRYAMAVAGVLAIIVNYWIARRLHRTLTRVVVEDRRAHRTDE